jgi:hypothetical protein
MTCDLRAANSGPHRPVIISELMYHPQSNNDDLEFIELFNVTDMLRTCRAEVRCGRISRSRQARRSRQADVVGADLIQ